MDLKQIDYFLALAREGNMTRAARQLNVVQPALSMQIGRLERHFGKSLFDRTPHGMHLTPAGRTLLEHAAAIRREVDRTTEEMSRLDGRISGRVAIGMITSAAQSTLASSSAKVAERYPEIRLLACEGYTDTLVEWVGAGNIDGAFVNMPKVPASLAGHAVLEEDMMFAFGAGNARTFPKRVSLDTVAGLGLVIPSRRHGLRKILDDAASEAGFVLKPRLEIDTLSAVCEIVATTDLVTVLPGVALYRALADRRLQARKIVGPSVSRSVAWVTNPRRIVSAAVTAVVDIIADDLISAASAAARAVR